MKVKIKKSKVAAELLVPLADISRAYNPDNELHTEMERLAHRYKISTLVILRRILFSNDNL
jgi:Zn-dependent peptidase ImmA (M78 family)